MAYGQITTSSGRTLTLTPDGWVNGSGEQLTPPSGAYGMTLSDMLTNRGMNASNPVDVFGKGRGYMDSNGVIRGVDAGGQEWSATPGVDMEKTRELQKFNADLEGKRLNNQLTLAQIAAAGRKEKPVLPSGYMWSDDGKTALKIPGLEDDKTPTEFQGKSATFGVRAEDADRVINSIGKDGSVQPGLIKRSAEAIPYVGDSLGSLLNWTQSPQQQQIEQAQRNFINAVLRQESGAAIGANEFDSARKQYFPQPGDSPEVIAQKAANRSSAIQGFKTEAGTQTWNKLKTAIAPPSQSGAVVEAISQAKSAIAAGAPRDAVIRRLRQLGVENPILE